MDQCTKRRGTGAICVVSDVGATRVHAPVHGRGNGAGAAAR
jgi:hypothetical protein